MDAKKIAKHIKPKYFKDSAADRLIKNVALAAVGVVIVTGAFTFKYLMPAFDRRVNELPLFKFFDSEEFKLQQARLFHGLPPSRELRKKYEREGENLDLNNLDEDLNNSTLFCKSLIQKRKATESSNPRSSKQLKLSFSQFSYKSNRDSQTEFDDNDGKEMNLIKSQDSNSKFNETRSSYFSIKKSSNTCPLCLKTFKTDSAYSAHMKQCAKTHKMTTQQLLGALELQKKQIQERKEMGLSSQISLPMKTVSKKKKESKIEPYDLALGLALSKSLTTIDPKSVASSEVQKSTLKEFGFTSANPVPGPSRRKNDLNKKSVLKERTFEDRQKIIVEKVAIVLLEENQEKKCTVKKPNFLNDQVPQLWNLGENNEKHVWYVDKIKELILPEEENPGKTEKSPSNENIDSEIDKLNLPQKEIYKDWNKMINNEKLSDLIVKSKDCHDVYLHSLVLFVRCPEILGKDCKTIFRKFNLSTVVIFIQYLYCGTLNGLTRNEVDNLLELSREFNYDELINVLNCLNSNLLGDTEIISNSLPVENETKSPEIKAVDGKVTENEVIVIENEKSNPFEDRDLFTEEEKMADFTRHEPHLEEEENSENESNVEKSYWSFIQHEKKRQTSVGTNIQQTNELDEEETNLTNKPGIERNLSDDSATRDLEEIKKIQPDTNSDCIILSSGSETKSQEGNLEKRETTPVEFEVPYFDPYDNFHCFSEEQFSPVGLHSQSLITGDISVESVKLPEVGEERRTDDSGEKEPPKKTLGYCSTPVTVRQSSKIKSASKSSVRKRKRCDLSASRILRKSLGLQQKIRSSSKKNKRDFAEALTNSILHELSKSSVFQPSPPSERRMFVEVTPVPNRDELVGAVTPSPNFSNMGESMLKEQLTKYGLKRSLAKSKAKKILRHIYEELHPLYNAETGKILKRLSGSTPKQGKKSKSDRGKNAKAKQSKTGTGGTKKKPGKKGKNDSFKESDEPSDKSIDRLTDSDSAESEFENLSETLTQSAPSNPLDLPSAFYDFLQNNPDYYQKILLYEPIWLEELQRKLKETFKKHFKMADLMDYLDQKCITFRSEAQARNMQKRNERKKEKLLKRKNIDIK